VSRPLLRALFALSLLGAAVAGLAAGCGGDQSIVGGACAAGYTQCGNECVSLGSNADNCGACGLSCAPGVGCVHGECGEAGDAMLASDGPSEADGTLRPSDASTEATVQEASALETSVADGRSPDAIASYDSTLDAPASDGEAGEARVDGAQADGPQSDAPSDGPESDGAPIDGTTSDVVTDGGAEGEATSAEAGDDASGDDGGPDEPLCTAPLVDCSGTCIDTTMDPANCGACGITCYSGICQSSLCVGQTSGSLVFIGHDFTTYSQAQARVLANAVLLPQSSQTVSVLSYERYTSASALSNVKNIIGTAAKNIGRTLVLTSTTTDSDVTTGLTIAKYGVLLVADQPAASTGTLGALGATWIAALGTFTQAGGIVVILDGDTGIQEMPDLVTSAQLLSVTAQTSVPIFTQLDVVVQTDAVALGVSSPYAAGAYSASFTTEPAGGSVVYVVTTPPDDAGASAPVVIHKVF
jgi:hypothetical protein